MGQVSAIASHWLEDCANFTPKAEVNDQYSANQSGTAQAASNPIFSMNNYTPLVTSGNDKNKHLHICTIPVERAQH
jgi:hypothetical protein